MKLTTEKLQELRNSEDYKERMVAEYFDIDDKVKKLGVFLEKLMNKELAFTPKSKIITFSSQYNGMVVYRSNLAIRCRDEGIDLSSYEMSV